MCADPKVNRMAHFPRPLAILPNKVLPDLADDVMMMFNWMGTDKGWMTDVVWVEWCKKFRVFAVKHRATLGYPPDQPILLYSDGHGSRDSPEARTILAAAHVVLCVLPSLTPHT